MPRKKRKQSIATIIKDLPENQQQALLAVLGKIQAGQILSKRDMMLFGIDHKHASVKNTATFFHVTDKTLRNWAKEQAPRSRDAAYNWYELHLWIVNREVRKALKKIQPMVEGASANRNRLETERIENQVYLQKLEIEQRENRALPREKVETVLNAMAQTFRLYWTDRWQHNVPSLLKALGVGANRSAEVRAAIGALVKESMDTFVREAEELKWQNVRLPKSS